MGSGGGCPACGASLAGAARCPSCGAAAGLLSLELPPMGAGASPETATPAPSPQPEPAKATPPIPSPPSPGPGRQRAALVSVPRSNRMELPPHCACCDTEHAGEIVVESGKNVVGGLPQVYTVDVSYCRECRRHLRRPGWRIAIFILALPTLFYAGWRLNPVRPESFLQMIGLGLAMVVAARALSYVLIPRFGLGRKHSRESRSLWVRNFDAERVTLAVCRLSGADREERTGCPDLVRAS